MGTNMKKQTDILRIAMTNNRPVLITGLAGTAKSATVRAVAGLLGYPVETVLLAGILPEDIGGLVRPLPDGKSFGYLAPDWFARHVDGNQPFVVFFDEINQASIQTLHALFYAVNDRTVAGVANPNMRIVAAGNCADENEFLTPLPAPLLDRFVYKIQWNADLSASSDYLKSKWQGSQSHALINATLSTDSGNITPRHLEQALMRIEDKTDDPEAMTNLIGAAAYNAYLKSFAAKRHDDDNRAAELAEIRRKFHGPKFAIENGVMIAVNHDTLLNKLSPEEIELVTAA